ncbi:MAG: alanine--tRNA ligase [Deltaproteobacteria bacterium RBG_13_52_11]|nr:MAG: alanine--tRNA ligase [Deltaproteobacteria bacterium RBG_13_52_11]
MRGDEVRAAFLHYFEQRGHRVVKSSPLVPYDDSTLLFTNAGMVQFKRVFLQEETREYNRATSAQKCLRAGGKHNDMENVGRTARHHTFFEMLGNFSFGDYFKEGAIEMGWEFLTQDLHLPTEHLWVSVFKEDDAAASIWQKRIGLPADRIVRMGEKDNFWAMGDTGPCGPCSEIIIDQGEKVGCGSPACGVGCDCDRFLELWNLVFMQYSREQDGRLTPLPKPSIDTGMGLERIAAVVQGVKSNYDTDLFQGIIGRAEEISGATYGADADKDVSMRVIADHARAVTFLLADGVLPANEGRGYVLRRIIRRALRHGKLLGIEGPFLVPMADRVGDVMGEVYPEIKEGKKHLTQILQREEERFSVTLDYGLKVLQDEVERLKVKGKGVFPGEVAFKLYDTFGFPIDLTEDIVREKGMTIDLAGFERSMEDQRKRARDAWKGEMGEGIPPIYQGVIAEGVAIPFVGYETLQIASEVMKIIKKDQFALSARQGEEVEIITAQTPFYGESGGQVGDQGVIQGKGLLLEVSDTIRPLPELIVHKGVIKEGKVTVGDKVHLQVDGERRQATARNHTATHLLQAALRRVVGGQINQAGSLVAPERLRFDFTHFEAIDPDTLERIEALVNRWIWEDTPVAVEVMATEEAIEKGATALFGEKYGEEARVISLGDYSQELCGGSHVARTGEIGIFKVLSESGIAAGVRRIEAVTGQGAFDHLRSVEQELKEAAQLLKARPGEVAAKVERLLAGQRALEREIEALRRRIATAQTGAGPEVKEINGIKVVAFRVDDMDPKGLREMGDGIKDKIGSGVVLVGGAHEGKITLVLMVTKDLAEQFRADELIQGIAEIIGGRGGGNPTLARAGSDKVERLADALKAIYTIVEKQAS